MNQATEWWVGKNKFIYFNHTFTTCWIHDKPKPEAYVARVSWEVLSAGQTDSQVDASQRKFAKPELAYGLAKGGQTDSQGGSQVVKSRFHAYHWLMHYHNNRLLAINLCRLALGGQTVKNLCPNLSSTKVNTSPHKSSQVDPSWCNSVAKWNASSTQVQNLHWLASPFGQGFTWCGHLHGRWENWNIKALNTRKGKQDTCRCREAIDTIQTVFVLSSTYSMVSAPAVHLLLYCASQVHAVGFCSTHRSCCVVQTWRNIWQWPG